MRIVYATRVRERRQVRMPGESSPPRVHVTPSHTRRVHSYLFTLVNPAALGIRTVPRSAADIAAYSAMAIAECHRDHRHVFATRHERRAAVCRPNEYSRLCPTFGTCSPYILLDSHPRGPK